MTKVHVLVDEKQEYDEVDRPAEAGDDKSVIDLLANLARRVTSLERQLADTQHNLDKFAQQTEANTKASAEPTFTLAQIIEALGGARR